AKGAMTLKISEAEVHAAELESARELLNVSQLEILVSDDAEEAIITVTKAEGARCERCWHWETNVGENSDHPTLCGRCVPVVSLT
ncbi:MAG: zinc finger domain-containing protein, partial [Verrucomicrobiia bacterium]